MYHFFKEKERENFFLSLQGFAIRKSVFMFFEREKKWNRNLSLLEEKPLNLRIHTAWQTQRSKSDITHRHTKNGDVRYFC